MRLLPRFRFTMGRMEWYAAVNLILVVFLFWGDWLRGDPAKWAWIAATGVIALANIYLILDLVRYIPETKAPISYIAAISVLMISTIILSFANIYLQLYRIYGQSVFNGSSITSGDFLYYSITTFTNTGYGDITPLSALSNGASAAEMLIGFFMGSIFTSILVWKMIQSFQKG